MTKQPPRVLAADQRRAETAAPIERNAVAISLAMHVRGLLRVVKGHGFVAAGLKPSHAALVT
jgi:hypothetical protein